MDYIIDVWRPGQGSAAQPDPEVALFTESGLLTFLRGVLADEDTYPDGSKFALTADSKGAFGPSVYVPIGEAMYQKIGGKIIALREEGVLEHLLEQIHYIRKKLHKKTLFFQMCGLYFGQGHKDTRFVIQGNVELATPRIIIKKSSTSVSG